MANSHIYINPQFAEEIWQFGNLGTLGKIKKARGGQNKRMGWGEGKFP